MRGITRKRRSEDRPVLLFAATLAVAFAAVWGAVHLVLATQAPETLPPSAAGRAADAALAALDDEGALRPTTTREDEALVDAIRTRLARIPALRASAREAAARVDLIVGAVLVATFLLVLLSYRRARRGLARERARLDARAAGVRELLDREKETVRRLHEVNRMKGDLVSTASHELRTPLTSILGLAATLRQPAVGDNPELRAELLGRLEEQGRRLLKLIEQLLETSGLEHRRYHVRLEPVRLDALAAEVVSAIPRAESRVRIEIDDSLPPVVTDRDKVGRILRNLVDNALKYSPRDAPCVVGASHGDGSVRVWVEDRGIGMTGAEAGKVFDPFYQANSGATRHEFGVGLGLHLVKLLVEALDGRVDLRTEPGRGSRFTVTLPAGAAAGDRPAPRTHAAAG